MLAQRKRICGKVTEQNLNRGLQNWLSTLQRSPFFRHHLSNSTLKGEVRRKMNFTYVLGFVVLRDVVKVFPVSSSSFARKKTGRNRARSHSGAWRGLKTKWDLKWDVFTKFRAKLPAERTDWRAFQLAFILYGGRRRRKFGGPLWKEKRAIMLCHRFWVFPGCSTKTDSCKFELVLARTACFWRNIYGLTLEARQACRGQSKQCRSVSFHHPPADASFQKQWLIVIPLTNTLTSSKRTPMSAESTSSGDVDSVVIQP